ncbi:MAG: S-layer homology domain-containing protein [Oscillospiraceae bacterium]|nr:S-layer homology domain-containing protein [Oscillospiraceae bacterium]
MQGALDKNLIPEAMIEDCNSEDITKTLAEATDTEEAVTADLTVYTGEFNGNEPITREETAVIAVNCLGYAMRNSSQPIDLSGKASETAFSDSDIYEEYINSVDAAYSMGLIEGMGDGTFRPKNTLTRAQAAAIISRLADLLK